MFIIYGLDTSHFKDERVPLFIKALRINAPLLLKTSKTITIEMLHQILQVCDTIQAPLVFIHILSNILPHAVKQFDVTRHLTRGDLIFSPSFCTIIIK